MNYLLEVKNLFKHFFVRSSNSIQGDQISLSDRENSLDKIISSEKADINEGAIFFEYSGANSILMWFEDTESDIDSVLSDTYTSFVQSQPDVTFSLEAEGDVTVDSKTGKYLSFSTTSSSGDNGGGIIGSWRCSPDKVFASTATGSDATVVQIRFKRLLDEFTCST